MIRVRQDTRAGDVVVEFSGGFDLRGADDMASVASAQPEELRLVIDISRASNIDDSALGRLVDSLPRSRPHSIRGANLHQSRLLKLLGEPMVARPDPAQND
jgi:hypothetical protein